MIFLTARDARSDQIAGLTYGGGDWFTKPFDVDVLLARVRAVLRRIRAAPAPDHLLRCADVELDLDSLAARRGGRAGAAVADRAQLLRYFLEQPGRVLSRAQILRAVWEYEQESGSNVVDTYVG